MSKMAELRKSLRLVEIDPTMGRKMKSDKPTLGTLLRGLRKRKGWTVKEMSDRSGIPFSTLSKVETGRLTLGYDKLQQLSRCLEIRMSELFAEGEQGSEASSSLTARRSLGHIDRAIRVNTGKYDYRYLCTELRRKRMIPIIIHVRAKTLEEFDDLVHHQGEEFTYVLRGRVVVHTEHYDPVLLEEGESIYLDSSMGHAYLAAEGCDEAVVLGVCSSADEDLLGSLLGHHDEGAISR